MLRLTEQQVEILSELQIAPVAPDHFSGRGYVITGLVKRGLCQWQRDNMPKSLKATGLEITSAGRAALRARASLTPAPPGA